jgi:RNA polymerase sigma-70 factor (ECF subfamily)
MSTALLVAPTTITSDACAALLTRSSTGDRRAFGELYALTAPRLLGMVMRVLRDRAQSEEVVQEVFLEVWQSAARFDGAKGSVVSLMLTIAHRRAIDRVRSSQASRNRDLVTGIRDLDTPHDSVAEAGELSSERRRIVDALRQLTALQREAVTLGYFEGLTAAEMSARLGVSVGTVKTRMRDGLLRLRAIMS